MTEQVKPEVLISRLTHANEQWRVEAEARLIALGPAAVDPLIHALQHANPAVRVHAVHALSRIKEERAIAPVVAALGDPENLGAGAIAAEKALTQWGAPAKPALLEASRTGPETVRARAIRALGKIGGGDLVEPLRALLTDPLPSIRTQSAAALAAVGSEAAVEWVAPLLGDADKWVRYGVAEALVKQRCVRGDHVLQEALADPEEQGTYVRFWAEDLLDEIEELRRTGRALE